MIPTWISRVAKMMENGRCSSVIITDTCDHFQGITAVDVVAAMQEIDRFNKAIHKVEMARLSRLAGVATPYNNSLYMDS